jgi:hypothetical protein
LEGETIGYLSVAGTRAWTVESTELRPDIHSGDLNAIDGLAIYHDELPSLSRYTRAEPVLALDESLPIR